VIIILGEFQFAIHLEYTEISKILFFKGRFEKVNKKYPPPTAAN
jgi:hypothetical protein